MEPAERQPARPEFGAFLDDLVHELRTPLTAVAGYTALLIDDRDLLPPDCQQAAAVIEQQAQRLSDQVALLLDIARLWSGRGPFMPALLDLAALVRAAARPVGATVAAPRQARALIDRDLLVRALAMLLDNARRHGAPPLSVSLARAAGQMAITVSDHGPGVSPKRAGLVGLRPFQAPPRDGPRRGTGLSLVFVAAVADQHGGALSYARVDGVSRLTLTLATPPRDPSRGARR